MVIISEMPHLGQNFSFEIIPISHLFTQNHENNTLHISTDLKLSSSLYLRPGVIASLTPHFNYTPFLLISMNI